MHELHNPDEQLIWCVTSVIWAYVTVVECAHIHVSRQHLLRDAHAHAGWCDWLPLWAARPRRVATGRCGCPGRSSKQVVHLMTACTHRTHHPTTAVCLMLQWSETVAATAAAVQGGRRVRQPAFRGHAGQVHRAGAELGGARRKVGAGVAGPAGRPQAPGAAVDPVPPLK
jgi:hypothetical protein